jgi:hypothetical protein
VVQTSKIEQSLPTLSDKTERAPGDLKKACDELGRAIDNGKMGDIVAKHEKLILHYYEDVQRQAQESFNLARFAAIFGFSVLVVTVLYTLLFNGLNRFGIGATPLPPGSPTVGLVGIISAALIEFISGVVFWLYARSAKQFSAFHICLERTHRYLLAFKITEELTGEKDKTLHELVCIMANAPMITRVDIDTTRPKKAVMNEAPS